MLNKQRRIRPLLALARKQGKRQVTERFGIDEDVCTGDHACIRLSGCPTLTLKDNPDPLKLDPVATVIDGCVGCGLCGANAHAATLCPSFYRAEVVRHAGLGERLVARSVLEVHAGPRTYDVTISLVCTEAGEVVGERRWSAQFPRDLA